MNEDNGSHRCGNNGTLLSPYQSVCYQSEYVAERDRRREFVSGFSGSHGDAVVTRREAAMWTDGRYYLQADEQLDCHWLLMRRGQPGVPSIAQWLSQVLPPWARVGADPRLVPHVIWDAWTDHLGEEEDKQGFGTLMAPNKVHDIIFKPLDKRIGVTGKLVVERLRKLP
uniref:Creatinase N-terminal domain-containing protein n=1 Tax=Timema cristinae TaxID=61476 RepID=A0A7R9H4V6_TIMCR|nr:unnamed protein product [Timema cristinae]